MEVLNTQKLTKYYGRRCVLNNISLSIQKGSIFGLLGPNGSGKTTTLGILLDIIPPTEGSFSWLGQGNKPELRKKIGALLETPNFYPYLSAERNLKITADIKGVDYSDIDRVLGFVRLADRKKDKFKTFSLGMKQRLAIASALLGNPQVLILDEPTNGLDPQGIAEIRKLILEISAKGITIILASHILDEVEKVCTDVAILKTGNLLYQGKVNALGGSKNLIEIKGIDPEKDSSILSDNKIFKSLDRKEDLILLELNEGITTSDVNRYFFERGIVLSHLQARSKNLEMEFLELTGERN